MKTKYEIFCVYLCMLIWQQELDCKNIIQAKYFDKNILIYIYAIHVYMFVYA